MVFVQYLSWVLFIGLFLFPVSFSQGNEKFPESFSKASQVLSKHCFSCHSTTEKIRGGLDLSSMDKILKGGSSGQVVVPGKSRESLLIQMVQPGGLQHMPPKGQLSKGEIEVLKNWVDGLSAASIKVNLSGRDHWAFQKPANPPLPKVNQIHWAAQPLDAFVLARLEAKGLKPSPKADKTTLIRRAYFDLTGLPPSTDAIQKFLNDDSANAFEKVIDELLASPAYGERWGRHWLDLTRYADSGGFHNDVPRPNAWRYRDYVIKSINEDKPFAQFIREQLAGDEMENSQEEQLIATGFGRNGPSNDDNMGKTPQDIEKYRLDELDGVISNTFTTFLGVTLGCARCHDHKYDPIPQADYYSLYGVFASSDEPGGEPSPLRLIDRPQPVEPVIFLRGSPGNRGPSVPRRFLSALAASDTAAWQNGSGRLELAQAITSPSNPLTARVTVNRIWMHLFGTGLVDTPGDFGVRTERPRHAELLDWLSAEFMEKGWSRKSLLKTILQSETYRQCSDRRTDAETVDPENRLLARMNRLRLDFEAQRDTVLAASGQLDLTVGGPSADLASDPAVTRRAVYARIERQNLPGIFRTFDLASPDAHAPKRYQTTIPQQALFYLNNPFVLNQSSEIARLSGNAPDDRIQEIFRRTLRRNPADSELIACQQFLQTVSRQQQTDRPGGWLIGWGALPEGNTTLLSFQPLTVVREGRLQGGEQLPDPELGWVFLNRSGGHPGNDLQHCAVRRWTADNDCRLLLHGVLTHSSEQGDGVRLRVLTGDGTLLAETVAANGTQTVAAGGIQLQAGQTVDFVVDCRSNSAHDSFRSKFVITQTVSGQPARLWNSEQDFRETPAPRLDPWAQLAQTLLLTNEFAFID